MPFGLDGSKGGTFPSWTTAGRPASPVAGQTGYNSTLGYLEQYNGSAWVNAGQRPAITQTIYTSGSGTYTTPAGVTWFRVRMVGGGGGGGGISASGTLWLGGGGGGGGYTEKIISSPSSSYAYAIGAGGTGGTAGTSGFVGGAGGSGVIIIEEHYNW